MYLFDFTPITFILDLQDPNFQITFREFLTFFQQNSLHSFDQHSQIEAVFKHYQINPKTSPFTSSAPSQLRHHYSQPKMTASYLNGCNLWLLKPADCNRGRGINLFNRLSSLEYYLKSLILDGNACKSKLNPKFSQKQRELKLNFFKTSKFVIQKYLERPMLIDGRKFDIRVWALVDHTQNLFFFKEGYIRLSSELFNLNEESIENIFIHLTNNAIQKDGKNYGKHESGNIISFQELKVSFQTSSCKIA